MRIAIISDIHGNLPALRAVLSDIASEKAVATVCLGDIAFKGPAPGECVELLRDRAVTCVYGNTDLALLRAAGLLRDDRTVKGADRPYLEWHVERMPPAALAYLAGLSFSHTLEAGGQRIMFVHATPQDVGAAILPTQPLADIEARVKEGPFDWLLMGHIHAPFYFRCAGKHLVNTGAVGFSLDGDWRAAYALLDTATWAVTLKRVEYDVDEAVALAHERDFCFDPDWYGEAIRTGFWDPIPWERRGAVDRFPR